MAKGPKLAPHMHTPFASFLSVCVHYSCMHVLEIHDFYQKSVEFRITAAFFSLCCHHCHHCRRLRHRRRCHHQSTANIAADVAVVTHYLRHCPPKLLQNSFPLFNSLVFDFYRLCASFALLRTTRIWWSTIWFLRLFFAPSLPLSQRVAFRTIENYNSHTVHQPGTMNILLHYYCY